MAIKLLELVYTDACDAVLLMTGDTDLVPAVRTARHAPTQEDIRLALPYRRHNRELRRMAPNSLRIGKERFAKYQFSDPYVKSDGRRLAKPSHW